MSMAEINVWTAYRKKYGPMNDVRRHDRPAALLAHIITSVYGGKAKIKDFLPFGVKEDENREATLDDFIKAFGGVNIVR